MSLLQVAVGKEEKSYSPTVVVLSWIGLCVAGWLVLIGLGAGIATLL
jgi:hypothetical protein